MRDPSPAAISASRRPVEAFSRAVVEGLKRPALPGRDLVSLELVLGLEKRLHVPDEGFGDLGRQLDTFTQHSASVLKYNRQMQPGIVKHIVDDASYSRSGSNPSADASGSAELHLGQGAPAAPQLQACGPSQAEPGGPRKPNPYRRKQRRFMPARVGHPKAIAKS
jgi:hypothetical protein